MLGIGLSEVSDFAALETRWRALQERARGSFFQSWTWTGCLLRERFPDPVLLEARWDGATAALALFNRRGNRREPDRLWLGESGIGDLDAAFIEHNGVLLDKGREDLLAACLRAALGQPIAPRRRRHGRSLILSGVDENHLRAARGVASVRLRQVSPSPFVDLAAIRGAGRTYPDGLSANTRYQIRRSIRRYATAGPLCIRRAETLEEAHDFLSALAELHQATWTRRGKPGAFANPSFVRFHRELLGRAFPRREVDLLRISAGSTIVGYLYNFRFRGMVGAYQSGFDYGLVDFHRKPGLTCHAMAIEMYLGEGAQRYDFLAGGDRYKTSLANAQEQQYWLRVLPRWSVAGFAAGAREAALL
jgi:CelD/BcsL family acetyltransferase involved in cellulose biosynthesis